jgi:hypothetical protein
MIFSSPYFKDYDCGMCTKRQKNKKRANKSISHKFFMTQGSLHLNTQRILGINMYGECAGIQ